MRNKYFKKKCIFAKNNYMTFNNLHADVPENCNCVEKAREDVENIFARYMKCPPQTIEDIEISFLSHWEKARLDGIYPKNIDITQCTAVCNYKGVSVHKWTTDEDRKLALKKFEDDFKISRKPKDKCLFIFQFLSHATLVEQSGYITHYNCYKSDEFSPNLILKVSCILLKDFFAN